MSRLTVSPKRLDQAAHLAVAAFLQHDVIPMIGALSAAVLECLDLGRAVLELDARQQRLLLFRRERADDPHRILALDLVTRVHHLVRELAGIGEQQQALGVEVEAPDRDPLAVADVGQLLEHGGPPFGIVARDDLARGLVVHENARARLGKANLHELAVDAHFVTGSDLLTHVGGLAVHGDPAGEDKLLHRAA